MNKVTFITGNQGKADFLAKHLDFPVEHQKVDVDEVQSLDLPEIAEHKAKQAYETINSPVLVEDVGLVFESMGKLPGPFIKWFEISLGLERICKLVDNLENRKAIAQICFVYFDGESIELFQGELKGQIADKPRGAGGFGFDPIFIPNGAENTLAEMDEDEIDKFSLRTTTVYPELKIFLEGIDKA